MNEKWYDLPGADSRAASGLILLYSITRSTDVIWFSTSADCLTPNWNEPVSIIAEEIANPALAGEIAWRWKHLYSNSFPPKK